jgi:hypothetical protein
LTPPHTNHHSKIFNRHKKLKYTYAPVVVCALDKFDEEKMEK